MFALKPLLLALSVLIISACAQDKKYVESQSPYCQSNMVENQFIVHWKRKNPTLITEKNIQQFIYNNSHEIQFVEPNYTLVAETSESISSIINVDESSNSVYDMIHVRSAWYRGYFGQGLTVAVIDTGIDIKHPNLRHRLTSGWNFISNAETQDDETGHGTAMAGIITGPYLNNVSLSLAPDVKILPIDFMNEHGGTEFHAEQAISYAISHHAKIINNSWTVNCSELLRDAFVSWSTANVIFINSSGNEPVDVISHGVIPASLNLSNHIQVGSLDERGHRSTFSGFGSTVRVYAPGESVPSIAQTNSGSDGVRVSGTSASTAIVSAAAALLWSAYPQLTASDLVALIIEGAQHEPRMEPILNIQESLALGRERYGGE